jgi:WD40 repeat protein
MLAAEEWLRHGRDDDVLLRGARLSQALAWRDGNALALSGLEREFLACAEDLRAGEHAARRRRVRLAFAGMAAAIVAIGIVALIAVSESRNANSQRDAAGSRALAGQSAALLEGDPGLSLGLGLEGLKLADTEQARAAVRQATLAARQTHVWRAHDSSVRGVVPHPDGHRVMTFGQDGRVRIFDLARERALRTFTVSKDFVLDATFSPDGRTFASSDLDGDVTIRRLDGSRSRVVLDPGPRRPVGALDIGPRGRTLAAAMADGSIRLVDLRHRRRTIVLPRHDAYVNAVRFDRTGASVVSAGPGGARIWDVATRRSRLLPHRAEVYSVAFSPDARLVATASADGFARIFSARSGRRLASFRAAQGELTSVRFDHRGRRVVTAGEDGVLRVWTAPDGIMLGELRGHRGAATSADFLPGDKTIVSGGEDGTLRSWLPIDATAVREPATGVSFSPDGRRVLSGGQDGEVRIWDPGRDTVKILRGQALPSVARYSANGSAIVSASQDGSVRVWPASGGASRRVAGGSATKFAAAFDPTGRRLAIARFNPGILVQRVGGGGERELAGHTDAVLDVTFSPDGRYLLSASRDGTARIWRADDGHPVRVLRGHRGAVSSATYSADGSHVVTAGGDGTVRIWRVAGGPPVVLYGHQGAVQSAQFNRAGDRVVSAGVDGTVRIWDVRGGEALVVLYRHHAPATAAFSPDGRHVASSGRDGVVRLDACTVCGSFEDVLRGARQRADRELSPVERERFVRDSG